MSISRLRKPPIEGLLARCQVLDTLSLRVIPSNTDGHKPGTAYPRALMLPPNLATHVPRPPGQPNQPVTRRQVTRHGLLITAPPNRVIAPVSPDHLVTRTFSREGGGVGTPPHFLLLQLRPLSTAGRGRGQERKAEAPLALPTTLRQFTSQARRTMKSDVLKPPNLKGPSRKLREKIVLDYSQRVLVLELP